MIDNRLSGDCDRISLLILKGRDREIKIDERVNRSEEGDQIDQMINQGGGPWGCCRQRHMTTPSRTQLDRFKASEARIMIRQLTQESRIT